MNICFFTKHEPTWGSSRERVGAYFKPITDRGHKYFIIHVIPNRLSRIWGGDKRDPWLFRKIYSFWHNRALRYFKYVQLIIVARRFDLIFIQKVNLPYSLLRLVKLLNKNIIFDFDDLCFLTKEQRDSTILEKIKSWWNFSPSPDVLKLFSHIIAGNNYLADVARGVTDESKISVIPTAINCDLYFPAKEKNNSPLVIGFAGSGENHLKNLKLLAGPLDALSRRHDFVFKLVGAMNSDKIKSLFSSSNYKFVPIDWVGIKELAEIIRTFDIGVMPLIDDLQSRGKCAFKALAYMASGVATVASGVGVNKEIIKDGVNGFLAGDGPDWVQKLSDLLNNGGLRARVAREGRKTAEEFFSLKNNSRRFMDLIEGFQK